MRPLLAIVLAFGVSLVACTAGTANSGNNDGGDDDDGDDTSNGSGGIDTSNLCEDLVAGKRPAGYPSCPNDKALSGSTSASDLAECKKCERQTAALLTCAKKNSKCNAAGKLQVTAGSCDSELTALQSCVTKNGPATSPSDEEVPEAGNDENDPG